MLMVVLMLIRVTSRKFGIMAETFTAASAMELGFDFLGYQVFSFFHWADIFHTSLTSPGVSSVWLGYHLRKGTGFRALRLGQLKSTGFIAALHLN